MKKNDLILDCNDSLMRCPLAWQLPVVERVAPVPVGGRGALDRVEVRVQLEAVGVDGARTRREIVDAVQLAAAVAVWKIRVVYLRDSEKSSSCAS